MLQKVIFHLNRRDPDATHLEHVITAPGIPIKALSVTAELVAGVEPFAEHGLLAFAVLVPVEGGGAIALHQQCPHLVNAHLLTVITDDLRLKTGKYLTRTPDPHTSRTVPNKHLK